MDARSARSSYAEALADAVQTGTAPRGARAKDAGGGDKVAEHDWLATLNLVRRASAQFQTATAERSVAPPEPATPAIPAAPTASPGATGGRTRRTSVLVWVGCAGAALSWLLLLWFTFAPDPFLGTVPSSPAASRHHLVTVSQCGLLTALAALLAGVIRSGVETLSDRLAVLARPAVAAAPAMPQAIAAAPQASAEPAAGGPQPDAKQAIRRGSLGGRPYALFRDGSVDLETVFGVRSFASLAEAREFVGDA